MLFSKKNGDEAVKRPPKPRCFHADIIELPDDWVEEKPVEKRRWTQSNIAVRRDNWNDIFSASLGRVMANQKACAELVVKGRDWNVDFAKGVISFGQDEYPVQFIGSESTSSNSWLWGWENINGFSENLLEVADSMKAAGEGCKLEALTTAQFGLTDVFNGHTLSIVACSVQEEKYCYYRGPHDGGAVFMAFSGVDETVFAPIEAQDFINTTLQCIEQFSVNHRVFVECFLYENGTPYEWQRDSILAHFTQDLRIDFKQAGEFWRISKIQSA